MATFQSEQEKDQPIKEERLRRAFLLTLITGLLTLSLSVVLYLTSRSELSPYSVPTIAGSGVTYLAGAFLIKKRRVGLGLALFLFAALPTIVYVMSQNARVSILATVGVLVIYMMILPQILVSNRQVLMAQVGTFLAAALLILADLFWPFPRTQVPETLFNITAVVFIILLLIFGAVTWRQFPSFSLLGKLISTTLFVAIVAVVIVAYGVNAFTRNALTTEIGQQMEVLTDSQAALIGELLLRELTTLQTLSLNESLLSTITAQNENYTGTQAEILAGIMAQDAVWANAPRNDPWVTAVLQNRASVELRQFIGTFPENSEIMITDRYGGLVATTTRPSRYFMADEAWWQNAHNIGFGATYFSPPQINPRSGLPFIEISLPLFSSQAGGGRNIAGVLHATYSLKSLEDLMVNAEFGQTGQVRLHLPGAELGINEAGRLYIFTEDILSEQQLTELLTAEESYSVIEQAGDSTLLAASAVNTLNNQPIIDALNWYVTVQQSETEALAAVQDQQRFNILLGAFVVLFAGAAAAFVGRRLSEPILQLTAVAEKVTAGDLTARANVKTKDEIGTLATTLNSMTAQVQESIHTLEERVQARTRALETSIQVGRQISTILDTQALVEAVVNQVRDAFDYYHAHLYLLDEDNETLRLAGGTGTAGQKLLARGHKLSVGQGLVGQAAFSNNVVLVPDVSQVKDWLPNPLLPETKAEVAVPIMLGKKLLGVLDVQQNVANGLKQEDADVLISVTNQVAIALENARLLERVSQQAEVEAQINMIGQQIQKTTSVEEAMQIAIRELGRVTKAQQTSIQLAVDKTAWRL